MAGLEEAEVKGVALPGAPPGPRREIFVAQIIESERRRRYAQLLRTADLNARCLDPCSGHFDPLKAAVLRSRAGEFDEACWLVFLSVHFGKHRRAGWDLSSHFYGRLCKGGRWDWATTPTAVPQLRDWLETNGPAIRATGAAFGNHRKYESLRGHSPGGTGTVVATYIDWVGGSHADRLAPASGNGLSPRENFGRLDASLRSVARFGRTARFDLLTMLEKLGLADVEPDGPHLIGATGPLQGSRLLLGGSRQSSLSARELEATLVLVQEALGVTYDVLEDALCNWQKSPSTFLPFRG